MMSKKKGEYVEADVTTIDEGRLLRTMDEQIKKDDKKWLIVGGTHKTIAQKLGVVR